MMLSTDLLPTSPPPTDLLCRFIEASLKCRHITREVCNNSLSLIWSQGKHVIPKTLSPRQHSLEGVGKVENDPADDDVVIDAEVDNHNNGGYSDTSKVWSDSKPCSNWSPLEALPKREFQVEQGYAQEEEHDEVGNQECTCVCRGSISKTNSSTLVCKLDENFSAANLVHLTADDPLSGTILM